MRRYVIKDCFGLQEKEVVETENLIVIPEENIAIRKSDLDDEQKIFIGRDFPIYYAVGKPTLDAYRLHGKYNLIRIDTLKAVLYGRENNIIQDKFRDDRFFYDTHGMPLFRVFPVEIGSDSWEIFRLEEKFQRKKSISRVETTLFDPVEERAKLKFVYTPSNEKEFTNIYIKCLRDGFTSYSVVSYIIDKLDIAEYYIGE